MNKVIPVIAIIFSAFATVVAAIGLTTVCVSIEVAQLALVSVPTVIVGAVASGLSSTFSLLFFKSRICRVTLIISLCAFTASVAAIIVWLVAL